MKRHYFPIYLSLFLLLSCKQIKEQKDVAPLPDNTFVLSFGSCNNQNLKNSMWSEILKNSPDIFVWTGDIVYADTHDMKFMRKAYEQQKNDAAYRAFIKQVPVIGTWDDHDYGINDGGINYEKKDSVQQIFLDFFDVDTLDIRRKRKGVYHVKKIDVGNNSIKILLLDSRYFRTDLTKDTIGNKRYTANTYGLGNMLGKEQWKWLENELTNSESDFNIIVSSVQFLSHQHGFESWGNMPHEVNKLKNIIRKSNAKGVIILSGDRHIAEISKDTIENVNYPLIDFTSSGLTHSYSSFSGEANQFRISEVVSDKNFGILKFDFNKNTVQMEIRGENNQLFESHSQKYGNL